LLENGSDSETSTRRESSSDVDVDDVDRGVPLFDLMRHCFTKYLENEEA